MSAFEAVDLHEKPKNFLTEAEVDRFLQAAKSGRHGIRDHLMMLDDLQDKKRFALVPTAGQATPPDTPT